MVFKILTTQKENKTSRTKIYLFFRLNPKSTKILKSLIFWSKLFCRKKKNKQKIIKWTAIKLKGH